MKPLKWKRADKTFSKINGIIKSLGAVLFKAIPQLKVDVHEPDFIVRVEIRENTYIYRKLSGGLPVGSNGKATLISGDSPVAG